MWAKILKIKSRWGKEVTLRMLTLLVLWGRQGDVSTGPTKGSGMGAAECSQQWGRRGAGSRKIGWKCVLEPQTPLSAHIARWFPLPPSRKCLGSCRRCAGCEGSSWGQGGGCEGSSQGRGRLWGEQPGQGKALYWEQEDSVKVCILNSDAPPGWLPEEQGSQAYTPPPHPRQGLKGFLSEETDLTRMTLRYWHWEGPCWKLACCFVTSQQCLPSN